MRLKLRLNLQQDGEKQENWEQSILRDSLDQVKVIRCMVVLNWLLDQKLSALCLIPAASAKVFERDVATKMYQIYT